jgi:outer membrane murein-binding lipoprotein Lpp
VARSHPDTGPLNEAEHASSGGNIAVFMAFVAAGCIYIITAKLEGIEPFYVTFVPVGIMIAYALLISLARGLRLRDDQSGDNLYYMGFLFTLTSLGVSLYQFSATRAAEEIVQNFGIAIGSTIAGIGLRVIFNQMRRDPVEVEQRMRLELAEAARRVRRELDASVVEFGYFRRNAQQSAADSFGHMTERFDDIVAKLLASLEEVTAKLSAPVEAAALQLGGATGAVSRGMSQSLAINVQELSAETEKLSSRVGAISGALDDVAARLHAMQAPDRVFEVRLDPVMEALALAAERIGTHSDAQAKSVTDALAIANTAAERSIDLVGALRQDFDTTALANRAALEWAAAMIKATSEVLNEIKASQQACTEGLTFMLEKADATMQTFTEVLVKSGVEMAVRTDQLSEALPAIEARARTLALAAERIAGIVDDLRSPHKRPEWEAIE